MRPRDLPALLGGKHVLDKLLAEDGLRQDSTPSTPRGHVACVVWATRDLQSFAARTPPRPGSSMCCFVNLNRKRVRVLVRRSPARLTSLYVCARVRGWL